MFFQVLGHFVLDRRLQKLPGSFAEQLFQVALGFIFGSLFERNHSTFLHGCILSFGASSEYAFFFLVTERMRLSLSCHPQLSVIARGSSAPVPKRAAASNAIAIKTSWIERVDKPTPTEPASIGNAASI